MILLQTIQIQPIQANSKRQNSYTEICYAYNQINAAIFTKAWFQELFILCT